MSGEKYFQINKKTLDISILLYIFVGNIKRYTVMKNAAQLQKIGFAKNDLFLVGFSPKGKSSKFSYWNAENGNKFEAYSNGHMTVVFDASKLWKCVYVFTNDCECIALSNIKIAINVVNQIMAEVGNHVSDNA